MAASKYACLPDSEISQSEVPTASRIANEIGTSMFNRPARNAVQACLKNGCAENAMVGNAIAAEIQWNMSRVGPSAPDQTATDNSITFIAANPATASRISRSRPALSVSVARKAVASSSCASNPALPRTSTSVAAVMSGDASICARLRVRFTRAPRTPS